MKYLDNKRKRVTAIGCQNGYLIVCLVDVLKNGIYTFLLVMGDIHFMAHVYEMNGSYERMPSITNSVLGFYK